MGARSAAFLVRHSNAYTYAITASFVEHCVESLIFPSLKTGWPITVQAHSVRACATGHVLVCCAGFRHNDRSRRPVHPTVGLHFGQAQFYARDPIHEAQYTRARHDRRLCVRQLQSAMLHAARALEPSLRRGRRSSGQRCACHMSDYACTTA
jgi:hypothetical protein